VVTLDTGTMYCTYSSSAALTISAVTEQDDGRRPPKVLGASWVSGSEFGFWLFMIFGFDLGTRHLIVRSTSLSLSVVAMCLGE
jgi:hypothetical protein